MDKKPRIAKSIPNGEGGYKVTMLGNRPFAPNKVTSLGIKIKKAKKLDDNKLFAGVAPFDINQDDDRNTRNYGWYLDCCDLVLRSGPPHNYDYKEYGPFADYSKHGKYVQKRAVIDVVMDTKVGGISFALGGKNYGPAYSGVPLDKPLVICVIHWLLEYEIELIENKVK